MKRSIQSYTDLGGRPENEDTVQYAESGKNLIVVLADGLGGQGDGKAASTIACESLIQCGVDGTFPTKRIIETAFQTANETLIRHQKNDFHMKTTAVYFCTQDNQAIWAHIGDSRLYHVFKNRIADFTLDHSASQLSVFMGNITREQIPTDPGRSRLIRAMGVKGDMPEIHDPITLEPGHHAFLLCSDGLWEYLSDSDIISCCENAADAKTCCQILREIHQTRKTPDCDNNSAVVVFLEVEKPC